MELLQSNTPEKVEVASYGGTAYRVKEFLYQNFSTKLVAGDKHQKGQSNGSNSIYWALEYDILNIKSPKQKGQKETLFPLQRFALSVEFCGISRTVSTVY